MAEVKMESTSSLDLPPNSYKSREKAPKKEEKHELDTTPLKGNATFKKKNLMSKLKHSFISEDAGSVGEYIVKDIILPTAKDLLFNSMQSALSIILYGKMPNRKKPHTPYSSLSSGGYTYNSISKSSKPSQTLNAMNRFDVDEIEFDYLQDAEKVRSDLVELIDVYGNCTIEDLYNSMEITIQSPYLQNSAGKYGWTNLSDARTRRYGEKYYLILPPYKEIKER